MMKMDKIKTYRFSFLFFLVFSFSCKNQKKETADERQVRIENTVNEKLEKLRKERFVICKKAAISTAESRVDSLLLAEAKLTPSDTIPKPIKPIKPSSPDLLTPKDSSEIKPLFEEIEEDSLQ